ncbi:MAG: double zinc ribbon domain-containing protein, partial [Candidatus Magasanikbacteria bacterium]|nr:double zinc ribbon domain-containing protein [Candidatus Magasanikbacteria bacterium]
MSSHFKSIKNHAKLLRDFFLDLIFPIECLGCGKEKIWLCEKCFESIDLNHRSLCPACDRETFGNQYCIYCQDNYFLNGIFIAGNYENKLIKTSIKNLKYHLIKKLAEPLGNFLALYFKEQIKKME